MALSAKNTKIEAPLRQSKPLLGEEAPTDPSSGGRLSDPDCELCEAARFTHWYAEDDVCWVADCEVCNVPMVVWRSHGTEPTPAELRHMHEKLATAGDERFGGGGWTLDGDMRTIPDHFHAHARDERWFAERALRPASKYTAVGAPRQTR